MELGVVPQHVAGSSRTVVPGSSVPSCSAPHRVPAFPSGVVTLAYKSDLTSETQYFPGIIITCEPGEGKAHTTFVFSSHKAYFNEVYVYFGPNRKVEGKVCASDHGFMIVIIVDDEYHEPLAWNNSVLASYDLVRTISIMSGTKLNAEATAPLQTLIGYLGVYGGQITTPNCNAATTNSCTILDETGSYFQFSCSFQDDFLTFKNMDLARDIYKSDSAISAPVFSLNGEFLGILFSSGNWPDMKTGLYSQPFLKKIEHLMSKVPGEWSKAKLKWSSTESV